MPGRRAFLTAALTGASLAAVRPERRAAAATDETIGSSVDVRDHGARGDGIADDTLAVRAAIDALRAESSAGGCVTFPPGTYRLSGALSVDHGTTLAGANPAACVLRMDAGAASDLVAGAAGFPVYVNIRDLTLDGGVDAQPDVLPPSDGTLRTTAAIRSGSFVERLSISDATCPLGPGDVLRVAGQPVAVINDGTTRRIGEDGVVNICHWAPAHDLPTGAVWQVYRTGSLVRGCGRLSVRNCFLTRARRHAIELVSSTQGGIADCEIGSNQGCGVFSWSSTDHTLSTSWLFRNGGPDLYTYAAVDVRVSGCIFEGSGSYAIYGDWSELEVRSSGLWGGRCGLVRARRSGTVRLSDLKLREPGFGLGDGTTLGSPGFGSLSHRPTVFAEFSSERSGLQMSQCNLADALPATGPMVWIEGGGRSNLSNIEWDPTISFAGGQVPTRIVRDAGTATLIRGCRGVPDAN